MNAGEDTSFVLDKEEIERRNAKTRERFLRYDGEVKRLLSAGQKSRYEAMKRQRAIDSIADEFAWRNIRSFDSDMLRPLNLADWQESRLAALNEAFMKKMQPLIDERSKKAAYRKYEADLRAMLSAEQNAVFDNVLYSMSWEAVPGGRAAAQQKAPAPPAEIYQEPEQKPAKPVFDPEVGFPGMHNPANSYIRELELYPEQLKSLDGLNRKYTKIFSDKYLRYLKDFLQHADTKDPEYFRKAYKAMVEENSAIGAKYEEEFKELLFYEQRKQYAESPMGKSLKGYAFMYRGGAYGLFYYEDFLRSVRLTDEQKKTLLNLNRDAARKMLTMKSPGDRGRVYAEYENALMDMLDERQRLRFIHMFDGSGIWLQDALKKLDEREAASKKQD